MGKAFQIWPARSGLPAEIGERVSRFCSLSFSPGPIRDARAENGRFVGRMKIYMDGNTCTRIGGVIPGILNLHRDRNENRGNGRKPWETRRSSFLFLSLCPTPSPSVRLTDNCDQLARKMIITLSARIGPRGVSRSRFRGSRPRASERWKAFRVILDDAIR